MSSRTEQYFLSLFDAPTVSVAAERAAEHVRATAGIGVDELPVHVFKLAQLRGLKIRQDLSGVNCPEGLLVPYQDGYVIRLKKSVASTRKRFSLAHEIGHTFFYKNEGQGPRHTIGIMDRVEHAAEETICDHFAGFLLMPSKQLEDLLASISKDHPSKLLLHMEAALNRFLVSFQALVLRISTLELQTPPFMIIRSTYRANPNKLEGPSLRTDWSEAIGSWRGCRRFWKNSRLAMANLISATELYDTWIANAERGKFVLNPAGKMIAESECLFQREEEITMGAKVDGKWTEITQSCITASCLYSQQSPAGSNCAYVVTVIAPSPSRNI
jgi:Zn-dependent peptidase ImmA (M78 family)